MRCTGYCTASSYDIPRLQQYLQQKGVTPQFFRDVIHVQKREDRRLRGDIFYFSYGALVCWGFTEEEERAILEELRAFEREPLLKHELDEFTFRYGEAIKIHEDEITLQNKSTLAKLAISHGIAQSVKLTIFEGSIQTTIEATKQLPEYLAKKGKIPLSRKEICRKIGSLFKERHFINLHTEVLDTPEFFWEYPELEPFYRKTASYLETSKRIEVLNKRLSVVHDLFEILSNELNHQQSSRLEWIIIILILVEVLLILMKDVFHLI